MTRQPLPGQDGIARLSGGPTSIVEAIEQRLEPGTVRLDSEVVAIETKENDLRVHLRDGAVARCATAILATPLRIAVERIRIEALDPRLSGVMLQTPTWMAQHAKAVILFKTPFWRDRGLSGRVASRIGPLVEIHDHSPENAELGALFGFVGWPAKDRQQDPETLEAEIRRQLVRCFGADAARVERVILHDWALEPLICSQADIAKPPEHPDVGPDLLRQGHLDDRLWFAVSETSDVSPGLIEGALVAGQTAAQRILSKR
ncbi:monoamine oxidase [Aliiruegeria lutimaris]|uniref:Monoamine oxidase n=1 Tax=Aliiruegeria lutimaris TaxID=571298 RepID=A0A1G9Q4C5_9RHOB|nr:monoamine oxidase [Aliiruegeria lutimaris]